MQVISVLASTIYMYWVNIDVHFSMFTYILFCPFTGIFDRDQSGTINFQEFQQLWQYIQQWKGVFDRYDQDKSGQIESHELHTALVQMGFNVSTSFIQLIIMK